MSNPNVFDKAKYHYETVESSGLPKEHAYHHTTFFLRWLIDNDLVSNLVTKDFADSYKKYKAGKISINRFYEIMDCCLADDMLTPDGNAFAIHYFDFENGEYLNDYCELLKGDLQSEYHIPFTEKNYRTISAAISKRYKAWKKTR